MQNKLPLPLLRGILRLTPEELERKLREQENDVFVGGEWNNAVKKSGVFIDLSQLRWVNLGAATQLVLLIESAKKSKIQVYVALPLKRFTEDEEKSKSYDSKVKERVREKREQANYFLKIIQFDRAIKCTHIKDSPEIKITEEFEFKAKDIDEYAFYKAFEYENRMESSEGDYKLYNYKYILPLRWLNADEGFVDSAEFETRFEDILSVADRGISNIDVLSLKNVVVSEIIKNVKEHAGKETKYTLLSIGLMSSKTLVASVDDELISYSNHIENDYLKWIHENNIDSFIEIYIGDSGTGLISADLHNAYNTTNNKNISIDNKIDKLKILNWAFGKWSTRKIYEELRGTKGLYRINRIINKYNGIFLIRSNELYGGYQKGGYSPSKWVDNANESYFNFPGTMIQLKLCPYKEVVKFNFNFQRYEDNRPWKTITFELNESNNLLVFDNWIKNKIKSESNILLIIKTKDSIVDYETKKHFLESSLKLLSHYRHPNGIVVYIADDIGKETLQAIAESTNELILKEVGTTNFVESITPDHENVYDPVLILEKGNSIFWFGGDQKIINILNEIYRTQNYTLEDLDSYKILNDEDKKDILIHFQNDDSLVVISKNKAIEFNFTNIQGLFRDRLKKELDNIANSSNSHKRVVTPKLKTIGTWLTIDKILSSEEAVGYALAMYLKMIEVLGDSILSSRITYILIDHNQQKEIAVEFAKLSGISKRNIISVIDDIDNTIPRRTPLFEENDEVIILTTIISSSETIRRLVKYVRRDIAIPKCIICLANYRQYDINSLRTWGEATPIISIYQHNSQDSVKNTINNNVINYNKLKEELNKCREYISPDYVKEDVLEERYMKNAIKLPVELHNHLINTKSLHYNHVGNINGRHFTFYINKRKLLSNAEFIWRKYLKYISDWMKYRQVKDIVLIRPIFTKEGYDIFQNIVDYLRKNINIKDIITWSSHNPNKMPKGNIVYIDFGSLTGNTINKFVSSLKNSKNILLCILFSQFKNSESEFYEIIKKIEIEYGGDIDQTSHYQLYQLSLFDEERMQRPDKRIDANIDIKFLYNLPIDFYNSAICPICEHGRVLDAMRFDDDYMNHFVVDRKNKLKIRDRKDLSNYPCDFYLTSDDNQFELSNVLIMKMYELKIIIEKSLVSTQYRIILFNYILNIYENHNEEIKNQDSSIYAMLYLISYEVSLLQKEPLVFTIFREMVSEISLIVATIDVETLTKHFEKSNTYNVSSHKLAVRYKYAAITVLRSSRKIKYCKNIFNILSSSVYNDNLSDNLMQNTLFHILSLFKNKHNINKDYYEAIGKALDKFIGLNKKLFTLSSPQISILNKIKIENERIMKHIQLSEEKVDSMSIIKKLKSEIENVYISRPHPKPATIFTYLNFREMGDIAWEDFMVHKNKSEYYQLFDDKRAMLLDNWLVPHLFIESQVIPHLEYLRNNILDSDHFSNFKDKFNQYSNIKKKFQELIEDISNNILNLIPNYYSYHEYYDYINNVFLKYAKYNESKINNSILLSTLSSFPTNLLESINNVFNKSLFKNISITNNIINPCYIFYPETLLHHYLMHIKINIEEKLNPGISLSDVILNINIYKKDKFINLELTNNNTDKYDRYNDQGELSLFKKDLILYNGNLEHGMKDNKIYSVRLHFLNYEDN